MGDERGHLPPVGEPRDLLVVEVARLERLVVLVRVAGEDVERARLRDRLLHHRHRVGDVEGEGEAERRLAGGLDRVDQVDAEPGDPQRARELRRVGRWSRWSRGLAARRSGSRLTRSSSLVVAAARRREPAEPERRGHAGAALHEVAAGHAPLLALVIEMLLELISIELPPVCHPLCAPFSSPAYPSV